MVAVEEAATAATPSAVAHRLEVDMGGERMSTGGVRVSGVRCWMCSLIALCAVLEALTLYFSNRRRARSRSIRRIFWTRLERARSTLVITGECEEVVELGSVEW